jgi:glycosyltransferase involved in cell wall biosynthesis
VTRERLLLVSPVRNEARHIERTVRAVAAQIRPPDLWLVVDDGSNDDTLALLARAQADVPFLRVLRAPASTAPGDNERRLQLAREARAFNWALGQVDLRSFGRIGKLDGDIEIPPDYFARLLEEFERDPRLGIAGGGCVELVRGRWRRMQVPAYHVPGALKLYTRRCFEAVGGIREHLGWDTIDETYARMRGFATRSFPDLTVRHHRAWGSVGGSLRGRARYGECAYAARYPAAWVALRSLKVGTLPPAGLSGVAFVYGFARAGLRRAPRVEDDDFRRHVRRELAERLTGSFPRRPR